MGSAEQKSISELETLRKEMEKAHAGAITKLKQQLYEKFSDEKSTLLREHQKQVRFKQDQADGCDGDGE